MVFKSGKNDTVVIDCVEVLYLCTVIVPVCCLLTCGHAKFGWQRTHATDCHHADAMLVSSVCSA